MNREIRSLKPQVLWQQFADICSIPHPSKFEEQILAHIKEVLAEHQIQFTQDDIGNLILSKAATPGFEDLKMVTLQAHVDMVPQKNSDSQHDFLKDPIKTRIDGEWVKATGTTLGADNGIGVAAILAIFCSQELEHGPLEALLTVDEEAGMTGAENLQAGSLKGEIMLNLDSEDEKELCIGCAGGINTNATFSYTKEKIANGSCFFNISITGLLGGHSGVDIHLQRGNANLILNRLLRRSQSLGVQLCSIDGGSLRNAIPREAFATIALPQENETAFIKLVQNLQTTIQEELSKNGARLKILASNTDPVEFAIDRVTTDKLIQSLTLCPDGVLAMNPDIPQMVDLSSNLAIVKSDDSSIAIATLQRAARESQKAIAAERVRLAFEINGAHVIQDGDYPGWAPLAQSQILDIMKSTYASINGKEAHVMVIHAGLECGIIKSGHPEMEMVSLGPTIRFPHSPSEKVHIGSVERFWNYLLTVLKAIPKQS